MGKSNEAFIEDLTEGYKFQQRVALMFMGAGLAVQVPPLRVRPTFAERGGYGDVVDFLVGDFEHRPFWMEVKSRTLSFTGVADFPYGSVFVETKRSWDRRTKQKLARVPDMFVIISKPTMGAIVVSTSTSPNWTVTEKWDSRARQKSQLMEAGLDLCSNFSDAMAQLLPNRDRAAVPAAS